MNRPWLLLLYLNALLCASSIIRAQTPPPDLSSPKALLAAAQAANGLTGDNLKPWHLKASYNLFDDDGKPLAKGVFEEWWAAKDKWKQSYAGDHYTGAIYRSPAGYADEGNQILPWPEKLLAEPLVEPLPEHALNDARVSLPRLRKVANISLSCIDVASKEVSNSQTAAPSTYCFGAGTTELRTRTSNYVIAVYNQLGKFQGRTIGLEALIYVDGRPTAKIHIDSLATDAGMPDAMFTPPSPASFRPVFQFGTVLDATPPTLISSKAPEFPREQNPHDGDVTISVVVDKSGRATDLHVLDSPDAAMSVSALKSVRTYKFKAAEWHGEPVAFAVNVVVKFRIR